MSANRRSFFKSLFMAPLAGKVAAESLKERLEKPASIKAVPVEFDTELFHHPTARTFVITMKRPDAVITHNWGLEHRDAPIPDFIVDKDGNERKS